MSSKELVFKHGDDYGVWKLKAMGALAAKDLFGLDMELDKWVKKNYSKVKTLKGTEVEQVYEEDQEKGLLMMWRLLDKGVIKKIGEVKTCMEVFGKLDIIYQKQGGVELIVLMHKLVNFIGIGDLVLWTFRL